MHWWHKPPSSSVTGRDSDATPQVSLLWIFSLNDSHFRALDPPKSNGFLWSCCWFCHKPNQNPASRINPRAEKRSYLWFSQLSIHLSAAPQPENLPPHGRAYIPGLTTAQLVRMRALLCVCVSVCALRDSCRLHSLTLCFSFPSLAPFLLPALWFLSPFPPLHFLFSLICSALAGSLFLCLLLLPRCPLLPLAFFPSRASLVAVDVTEAEAAPDWLPFTSYW